MRKKVYIPKRNVWLLKDDVYKEKFKREVDNLVSTRGVGQGSVLGRWDLLKSSLLDASYKVCGTTKGPPRNKLPWSLLMRLRCES